MIKKTITYQDYNGVARAEDFYFNLNRAEVIELEAATPGGLKHFLEEMVQTKDNHKLIEFVKELIRMSYGVKSPDGKYFTKTEESWTAFRYSEAFVELFLELGNNAEAATEFVNGIIPQEILKATEPAQGTNLNLIK